MSERRIGGFSNLLQALEYAAGVPDQQLCWFDTNGRLQHRLTYGQILEKTRLYAAGLERRMDGAARHGKPSGMGPRIGIIAVTGPDFLPAFCASLWVGGIACPLPVPGPLQDLSRYSQALANMCAAAGISMLLGPGQLLERLRVEDGLGSVGMLAWEDLAAPAAAAAKALAMPADVVPDAIAYVQFSSGSTGQPKGIAISHAALMHNIDAILGAGMALRPEDRAFSWLPYYHDMGLVGFVLAPLCGQVSVDYLAPSAFARRPRLWPALMAEHRSTITYAPPFAWQMAASCAASLASGARLDALRIAGVGGDYIDYTALQAFARAFAEHGFNAHAFKPSYGLAEATLAVTMSDASFEKLRACFRIDEASCAHEAHASDDGARPLVSCGRPLPGWMLLVSDGNGRMLPAGVEGEISVRGPAQLSGYFCGGVLRAAAQGESVETGDRGFVSADGALYVTGRSKDLIVVNGRNVWPLDVELAASEEAGIAREHMQLLPPPWPPRAQAGPFSGPSPALVLLLHEKAVRQSCRQDALKRAAAAATAAAGSRVRACMVPNGTIAFTSSGKKARASTLARFENAQIPVLADSEQPG